MREAVTSRYVRLAKSSTLATLLSPPINCVLGFVVMAAPSVFGTWKRGRADGASLLLMVIRGTLMGAQVAFSLPPCVIFGLSFIIARSLRPFYHATARGLRPGGKYNTAVCVKYSTRHRPALHPRGRPCFSGKCLRQGPLYPLFLRPLPPSQGRRNDALC